MLRKNGKCFAIRYLFIWSHNLKPFSTEQKDNSVRECEELKKQLQSVRSQLELQASSNNTGQQDQQETIDQLNAQLAETRRVLEQFQVEKTALEAQVEQLKAELDEEKRWVYLIFKCRAPFWKVDFSPD